MTAIGLGIASGDVAGAGWLHGLELVAVPVVLAAVVAMRATLARGALRSGFAIAGAAIALTVGGVVGQTVTIAAAAVAGVLLLRQEAPSLDPLLRVPVSRRFGIACLVTFVLLLGGLAVLAGETRSHTADLADAMYRAGSLVFGGGHVVLPLLDASVVEPGWVDESDFLAGYGAAQAMPGPLLTFSAYLGAVAGPEPNGALGAVVALVAIFIPSFLLLWGILPLWGAARRHTVVQAAVSGVAAAVVGLLAAALWDPVVRTAVDSVGDLVFAAALLGALRVLPVWAVVVVAAAGGALVF